MKSKIITDDTVASEMVKQIIVVIELFAEELKIALNADGSIPTAEAENMLKKSFKETAEKFKLTESTIRDKCTRSLDIDTKKFIELVIDYVTKKSDDLETILVNNRKDTIDSPTVI